MTREEIAEQVLQIPNKSILLELATGTGKSKLALTLADKYIQGIPEGEKHILLVYPMNTLISNWKDEIAKWGMEHLLPYITFTNYASLHKHAVDAQGKIIDYTCVIFDEVHHLSDLKREIFMGYKSQHNVLLSATVGRNLKRDLKALFAPLYVYKVPVKVAIEEEILPEPTIIKIPIKLSQVKERQVWVINPKAEYKNPNSFPLDKSTYWKLKKSGNKDIKYGMVGSALQYNILQNQLIEFYKSKRSITAMKNIFVRMCGDRLKWYAEAKTPFVLEILKVLRNYRTLTFCTSIEQADALGKNAIHSKNKKADEIKEQFNAGKIKHITAVEMLTEGANLADCKFGIWARYNTSETKIPQKVGRVLRHKNPFMILPYFVGTKEEEIVNMMCDAVAVKGKVISTTIAELENIIKSLS